MGLTSCRWITIAKTLARRRRVARGTSSGVGTLLCEPAFGSNALPARRRSRRTRACALRNGTEHPLDPEPVVERRGRLAVLGDRGDQVDHLVGEPVLIAQAVPGWPPGADVRVLGFGDQDSAEALLVDRFCAVEELQQVVLLEVEGERARRCR